MKTLMFASGPDCSPSCLWKKMTLFSGLCAILAFVGVFSDAAVGRGGANDVRSGLRSPASANSDAIVPVLISRLQPVRGVLGQDASFVILARGSAPFIYQWRKDGREIDGATGAILTLKNLRPSDVGSYDVVISNSVGSVTSNDATLTVGTVPLAPAQALITATAG